MKKAHNSIMTIGVDGNDANVANKVGVSMYASEMLAHFAESASNQLRFVIYLRSTPQPDLPAPSKFFTYRILPFPTLWRDVFLPLSLVLQKGIDVFFSPAHYAPRFSPVPVVVTIHDLAFIHYPHEFLMKDYYKLTNWTKHAINHAHRIIAVSESTRQDIVKHYKISEDRIHMIHNGFKPPKTDVHPSDNKSSQKNVLYVGTLQPRKNIPALIKAVALARKAVPDIHLTIVGKKGWMYESIYKTVQEHHIADCVTFTGYVDNDSLSNLYAQADVFVLPSLYEGFGIPILEAMAHGTPVIASNVSSLPEIGGDACLYFNPHDTIELKDTIVQLFGNTQLQKDLVAKGRERVRNFSWKKSAEQTLNVISSIKYER